MDVDSHAARSSRRRLALEFASHGSQVKGGLMYGRRDALKMIAALSAAGPLAGRDVFASTSYDPHAAFDLKVIEVELRRNRAGRMLIARIYQPSGPGPFPVILDLHGGAWNAKNRTAEEPMDRSLASSGLLVVAIDMTNAPEAPYPTSVQDANYGVR